jgi:hypothetical protein
MSLSDAGTVDRDHPWPGLVPYREVDHPFFKGRAADIDAMVRLVNRERLSVLYGLSGLGKTSLLRAGLFPRVRPEVLPIWVRLDFSDAAPNLTAQLTQAIARAAQDAAVEAPESAPGDTLWESFHRQDADFWDERNRLVTPLLVLDQFEEIFVQGRSDPQRALATARFLIELTDLAEGRPPAALKAEIDAAPEFTFGRHAYKLLLALREDFLPELESLQVRYGLSTSNRYRLERMSGRAALSVVMLDADEGDATATLVPRPVAENIVHFVAAERERHVALDSLTVDPALLSVVCRELNVKRLARGDRQITEALLEGSRDEILSDFYERGLADLGQPVRTFLEDRLLTPSGYRDSVALESALAEPGVTLEAIDRLVDRRLLRIEDRGEVQRLELTHDLLTGIVGQSRHRRRERDAADRAKAAQIEAEQARREARRRTRLAMGFGVLAVAAALTGGWALFQRQAAEDARDEAERAKQKAEQAEQDAVLARNQADLARQQADLARELTAELAGSLAAV